MWCRQGIVWRLLLPDGQRRCAILLLEGPFLRACFFLRFEDQKRAPSLSYCFASISIGLTLEACLEACPEMFCSNFHVSRHWSSRLALRPAFNFVSSYKLLVLLQFPSTWSFEACVEAIPLRQLRPKILARQHSCQLLQVQPCWDFNTVANYFKLTLLGLQ